MREIDQTSLHMLFPNPFGVMVHNVFTLLGKFFFFLIQPLDQMEAN